MFWFLAIILTIAATAIVAYLIIKNISVRWYEWLMLGIGFAILLFTVQNTVGSIDEREYMTAWMMMLTFGIPALILLAIPTVLIIKRRSVA
ncbi:MAG: dehalogenase [Chloroflexi bacterium]|nr:dehalogenase [Chloroflexota bacterium]